LRIKKKKSFILCQAAIDGDFVKLKVILEKAEEGGYVAYAPSLPGCISQGESREEALRNIKEAIELYLEPEEKLLVKKGIEVAEVTV
jgi:predicted RNase H-like HicB family nuclease